MVAKNTAHTHTLAEGDTRKQTETETDSAGHRILGLLSLSGIDIRVEVVRTGETTHAR